MTLRTHIVEAPESHKLASRALCGGLFPNREQHAVDAQSATCRLCQRALFRRQADAPASPWRYEGHRLTEVRDAVGGILDRIAGDYVRDDRPGPHREERWASITHALATLVVWRIDGSPIGASNGASVLEVGKYATRVQWTRTARSPRPIQQADDIIPVEQALAYAFEDRPHQCALGRVWCEASLMLRYVSSMTLDDIAAWLLTRGVEVPKKEVGRVTRWGSQRVYEYMRERELVPVSRKREDEMSKHVTGSDLHGWGEIASLLQRSERCVQEWAYKHGMPVYRGPGGRVEAKSEELIAWWQDHLEPVAEV